MFTFGRYVGRDFYDIATSDPGYVFWGFSQKKASPQLQNFLDWVSECFEVDIGAKTLRQRDGGARYHAMEAYGGTRTKKEATKSNTARAELLRRLAEEPQCEECIRFDMSGSNAFTVRKTCLDCGTVTKTARQQAEKKDPRTCQHTNLTGAGSNRTVHKTSYKDCGLLLDEEPQEVWEGQKRNGTGTAELSAELLPQRAIR